MIRLQAKISFSLSVLCLVTLHISSQTLTQSWLSDPTKSFGQQPSTTITITLIGTNPVFYTYATDTTVTPQSTGDGDQILNQVNGHVVAKAAAAAAPDPCDAPLAAVNADLNKLTRPGNAPPVSISVQKTITEWQTSVAGDFATLEATSCIGAGEESSKVAIEKFHSELFPSSGVTNSVAIVQAVDCMNYTVTFREYFNGQATGQSVVSTFSTACDQLTLSVGTILTALPSPTYASVTNPVNTQQQVLSIQNTGSLRPTIVGLLNYNLPWTSTTSGKLSWFRWSGLAVSTGPVFQNAQSNASVFGWYLGGSLSFYKRLYITAGEHWGQFPGTPYGLSEGSVIPPNYGNLNPQLRYSGRFALGITFQTTSFSKVGQQSATASGVAAIPSK